VTEKTLDKASDTLFSYDIIKYPAEVEVTTPEPGKNPTIGFNVDTSVLNFGTLFANGTSKRQINMTSKDDRASHVKMYAFGPVKDMIKFNETEFLLAGNKSIDIILSTGNAAPGTYKGEIDVMIQRSNNELMRRFLGF